MEDDLSAGRECSGSTDVGLFEFGENCALDVVPSVSVFVV